MCQGVYSNSITDNFCQLYVTLVITLNWDYYFGRQCAVMNIYEGTKVPFIDLKYWKPIMSCLVAKWAPRY